MDASKFQTDAVPDGEGAVRRRTCHSPMPARHKPGPRPVADTGFRRHGRRVRQTIPGKARNPRERKVMSAAKRQMHLGVFVLGTGNHSAGWRYEGAAVSNNDLAVTTGNRAHRRARQIRPPIHLRRAGHGPGRPPVVSVPVRADHPDFGAERRDPAYRARRHGVDQLCRALSRGPHLCLDRPF